MECIICNNFKFIYSIKKSTFTYCKICNMTTDNIKKEIYVYKKKKKRKYKKKNKDIEINKNLSFFLDLTI